MKMDAIFAGVNGDIGIFAKRKDDGIFITIPREKLGTVYEGGVYELEFENPTTAQVDLDNLGDPKFTEIKMSLTGTPRFLRSVTGKPSHLDVVSRRDAFLQWLNSRP